MIDKIELDHGITLDLLGSTCYLEIYYAENYCESISVDKAKLIIKLLTKFVEAEEEK